MKLVTKIFKRDDWYVTSLFGKRDSIITKNGITGNFHTGCDYGTNCQKWPQFAVEDGEIISCGVASDGAKYIWINYPRIEKKILHYHLDKICVKKGQTISEGTLLGYTGDTGKATGIHLHLGMKDIKGDNFIDPHDYDYIPTDYYEEINQDILLEVAYEVINGKYGNGKTRIEKLTKKGFNANEVQNIVNKLMTSKLNKNIKYVVKKGDTLERIAVKFNTSWNEIYEDNKNIIGEDPNLISVGQELIIKV